MKKIRMSKFLQILLVLIFLLILEGIIIFILTEKNRLNDTHKNIPGFDTKIPLNIVMNTSYGYHKVYTENISMDKQLS